MHQIVVVVSTGMISFSESWMVPTATLRQHVAFLFYLWGAVHHPRSLIPLRLHLIPLHPIVINLILSICSLNFPERLDRVVELVMTQEDRGR